MQYPPGQLYCCDTALQQSHFAMLEKSLTKATVMRMPARFNTISWSHANAQTNANARTAEMKRPFRPKQSAMGYAHFEEA